MNGPCSVPSLSRYTQLSPVGGSAAGAPSVAAAAGASVAAAGASAAGASAGAAAASSGAAAASVGGSSTGVSAGASAMLEGEGGGGSRRGVAHDVRYSSSSPSPRSTRVFGPVRVYTTQPWCTLSLTNRGRSLQYHGLLAG